MNGKYRPYINYVYPANGATKEPIAFDDITDAYDYVEMHLEAMWPNQWTRANSRQYWHTDGQSNNILALIDTDPAFIDVTATLVADVKLIGVARSGDDVLMGGGEGGG